MRRRSWPRTARSARPPLPATGAGEGSFALEIASLVGYSGGTTAPLYRKSRWTNEPPLQAGTPCEGLTARLEHGLQSLDLVGGHRVAVLGLGVAPCAHVL